MTTDLGLPPVLDPDSAREVLLAAPRGYCAGVDRAVITVEKALDLYGAPVYVRKQIVHNKHVVANLESRGAIFVEELDEVPEGQTVVFSAHGVSPAVHAEAAERGLKTIDATCPLVTKVHHEAKRFAGDDYDILLIGHEGHEEVEGTAGEAPDHIQLVQSPDDVANIVVRDPAKVAWLSQTTLSVDETLETVAAIREKFPLLLDPPSDDICYATQNRQLAVKEISPNADLVIVVGSRNSSNSVRLVEVALEAGAKASYLVDDHTEIDEAWLDGVANVSVTSGASVPEDLVDGVLSFLADRGYPAARAVHSAEESLIFALPPELRRDMRAGPEGLSRAMARYLDIHPDNPQPRLIAQVVEALRDDALIAYPTDSGYALGCQLGNRDGRDRILGIRGLDDRHHFTLMCKDFSQLGQFVHVDNAAFRAIKAATPGPYTFILPATGEVPKRLMHAKKRTVGVRIPDHALVCAILEELGEPILTSTLILPGEDEARTMGWEIKEELDHVVDIVIEAGETPAQPTSVIDWSGPEPEVVRRGAGDVERFEV